MVELHTHTHTHTHERQGCVLDITALCGIQAENDLNAI